jgi:hypothetical protein
MLTVLRNLAFGLWVGAMTGFAFIFAPIAFHAVGPTPAFATTIASVVRALTTFGYICAIVAIVASALDLSRSRRMLVPLVAALAMSALGYYETRVIVPQMERTALQTPAYDALHRRSSSVYSVILLLGVAGWVAGALPARPKR